MRTLKNGYFVVRVMILTPNGAKSTLKTHSKTNKISIYISNRSINLILIQSSLYLLDCESQEQIEQEIADNFYYGKNMNQ